MVFPNSPFTNEFDSTIVQCINKNGDSVGTKEDANLEKLLQWLCTTPEITSYRVNVYKYSIESIKINLENALKCSYNNSDITAQIIVHPKLSDVLLVKPFEKKSLIRKDKNVIVDPFCGAAVLRGSHIFAPGIMAMETGTRKNEIVSVYADITRKCKKGLRIKFDCSNKVFIGNGEVLMVRNELFGENLEPSGIAVRMIETTSGVPSIDASESPEDSLLLQNIPSIVCSHVLNPLPGTTVLDMCASPGNKTTHLGLLMKNQGILIALDKTPNKVKQLKENCNKFSLDIINTFVFDSTKCYDENLSNVNDKTVISGPPFAKESFDKILLDAPCSNLGKRPQLHNRITDKEVRSYVPLQRKLFTNAVKILKHGGHLVYSTCTITLSENEGIVAWALETFDCLDLILATPFLGGPGWKGTKLNHEQLNLVQRFGPDQETDSVGFFIAHFVKK